jgi:Fis family transcriptional regulator
VAISDLDKKNLQEYTRLNVRKYLHNLKGHQAKNLYDFVINQIEKGIIMEVLEFTKGNRTQTSEILGITRTTLRNKIKKHKL